MPNGSFKTITVTNKDWTLDKGKKYMKSIEPLVIEEDIKHNLVFTGSHREVKVWKNLREIKALRDHSSQVKCILY